MKGLILSGGSGRRLRPITHTSAKQLVPIANKPVLFYGIEAMAAAGISEIGIVVGETAAEIEAAVGDGSDFGVRVTYLHQRAPLGLAHCVRIAADFLARDDFVMGLGDTMLEHGIAGFVARFESAGRPAAQILVAEVAEPSAFGVAELNGSGRVVRLMEKPTDPPSKLALVGVYLFDATIHEAVRAIEPSGRGELEITDAIQWLIDNGHHVHHEPLSGWWLDTGQKAPLLECNRLVLDAQPASIEGAVDAATTIAGNVVIEAGASLVESVVRGPATIATGTRIERSTIGPHTSIGRGCHLADAEIDNSVILDGCTLIGVRRLTDSLLGQGVELTRGADDGGPIRLTVGDDSRVEL